MEQATFAELEHDLKTRRTRREVFLETMDGLVPWERLEARIEPFYPKAGRGRRPYPLGVRLRVHCVQLFYNLSDPGMEDLLYEVKSVRRFVGLRLSGALPDETTVLHFRHLLETHGLGETLFEEINAHLASLGHRLSKGTIVDASLIAAPSSTKNRKGERDPEMHQTKKGNQWHFGMKAHIGVDAQSGLTHSVETTPANVSDVATAHALLHGGEEQVWGDAGYQGVDKRAENRDTDVDWEVAMKPGKRRGAGQGGPGGGGGEAQGVGSGQGGTSVPVCEAPLRLREGALSGAGEEHATHRRAARVHQSAHRGARRHRLTWGESVRNRRKAAGTVGSGIEIPISWHDNTSPMGSGVSSTGHDTRIHEKTDLFRHSLDAGPRNFLCTDREPRSPHRRKDAWSVECERAQEPWKPAR